MRITGGSYRGRRLEVPPGPVRPTTDRMRESVFGVLAARAVGLRGGRFLDLFSGSGIVAVEAASRGAAQLTLVERDPRMRACLRRNTSFVTVPVRIHTVSCERFLARAQGHAGTSWDVVFVDPPYAYRRREPLLATLARGRLVSPGGMVVIHVPTPAPLALDSTGLAGVDRRRYGGALVYFLTAPDGRVPAAVTR